MQIRQKIGKWVLRTWKRKEKTKIYWTFWNTKVAGEIRDTVRWLASKDRQAEHNCLRIKIEFARSMAC